MVYPRVLLSKEKLINNITIIKEYFNRYQLDCRVITKIICGEPKIINILKQYDIAKFGDARIGNIIKYRELVNDVALIRIPMLSELSTVLENRCLIYCSSYEVAKAINKFNQQVDVVLMIDLGDLREGYIDYDLLLADAKKMLALENINIKGLGVNFACFGGVRPSKKSLKTLLQYKKNLEKALNIELEVISGGNTSCINLVGTDDFPRGITELRIGEALFFGEDSQNMTQLKDLEHDLFTLQAEIIEIKNKPSIPIGEINVDAFFNVPQFEDKGIRKKAICAIGGQDVCYDHLKTIDEKIEILGCSGDQMILDITDSKKKYSIGDIIEFIPNYIGVLQLMTSEYVGFDIG